MPSSLQTRGFNPGIVSRFTPTDPRYAVADPAAMLNGIDRGLLAASAFSRDAQAGRLRNIDEQTKQFQLMQEQAQLAAMPEQAKLRNLQLAALERQNTLANLAPMEFRDQPFEDFDEQGNLVRYSPVYGIDPQTGKRTDMFSPAGEIVKTKAQRDLEDRKAEAGVAKTEAQTARELAQAERNLALAEQAARMPAGTATIKEFPDYDNGRIVMQAYGKDGKAIGQPWVQMGPDGKTPVPPPPKFKESFSERIMPKPSPAPDPFNVPATAEVPSVAFAVPFDSMEEATMAARQGWIKVGQRVLIGGRPAIWKE